MAGSEIVSTHKSIIDIGVKYGYGSPDGFAKAFAGFHGTTPAMARKSGAALKSFSPLKIKFLLKSGHIMDYKIV